MRWLLIAVLLILLISVTSSAIITTIPQDPIPSRIEQDIMHISIENTPSNIVHWNISGIAGDDYHFTMRAGTYYVLYGDQFLK